MKRRAGSSVGNHFHPGGRHQRCIRCRTADGRTLRERDPLCLGPLGIDPAESECETEKVEWQICEEVGLMVIEKNGRNGADTYNGILTTRKFYNKLLSELVGLYAACNKTILC